MNELQRYKNFIYGFIFIGAIFSIVNANFNQIVGFFDSTSNKVEKEVVKIESKSNAETDELILKKVEAFLTDALINGRNGKRPPVVIDKVYFHNGVVVRKEANVSVCGELSLESGIESSFKMRYVSLPNGSIAIENPKPTVIDHEFNENWAKNCTPN